MSIRYRRRQSKEALATGLPSIDGAFNVEDVVEAFQFIDADARTHWHVNFGHPKDDALQDVYWANTPEGAVAVVDQDWIVRNPADAPGRVRVVKPKDFATDFEPDSGSA